MYGLLGVSAAVVVLDQATKWAALAYLERHVQVAVAPFLNFTLIYNRGAAFGFLNDAPGWQNAFFIGVALVASAVIAVLLFRLRSENRITAVGLALVLGGAVGNLIDRLVHGHVVDFIDVYYKTWHWPAFNIADSAITVGAILLVVDSFFPGLRASRAR